MNYKKLYEWASKIQMNGKPSLNYIFRDADGTFSAVSESMGLTCHHFPKESRSEKKRHSIWQVS